MGAACRMRFCNIAFAPVRPVSGVPGARRARYLIAQSAAASTRLCVECARILYNVRHQGLSLLIRYRSIFFTYLRLFLLYASTIQRFIP